MRPDNPSLAPPRTVRPEESLRVAAERMRDHGVGSLTVVDGQKLVGMVTDRDIALRVLCDAYDPDTTTVGEVMQTNPVSILLTATSADAAATMRREKVRRLPAVSPAGSVAGMVTHDDLVTQLSSRLEKVREVLGHQLVGSGPTESR